ncbi:MAG: hypothetical protein C0621_02340 [Desulfuromonas sp.]|nr:MAG: hypothetical protein C0621_02340 [Desulfuromonas sp.]
MRATWLMCFVLACFVMCGPFETRAEILKQGIDAPPRAFYSPQKVLVTDSSGQPHVFYGQDHLYHASRVGGMWSVEIADASPSVGSYICAVVDASDALHVSYFDSLNRHLKYASNASGSWVSETADLTDDVGLFTSLAVDTAGAAHISYFDENSGILKYTTNASGSWVSEDVETGGTFFFSSLALDQAGAVHIGYYDKDLKALRYATNVSASWVVTTVDSLVSGDVGYFTNLAIDSGDTAHLAYRDTTNGDLKYVTNGSGSWVTTTVDSAGDVGEFASLALDTAGGVQISYYDATNTDLKLATLDAGVWTLTTLVSDGNAGRYSSVAVDASGAVHVVYYAEESLELRYVYHDGSSWVVEGVDTAQEVGSYASLSTLAGTVNVAYYDALGKDLWFATNTAGAGDELWTPELVESVGDVGSYLSSATDASGNVHLAYYDATAQDLKYATDATGSWVSEIVDATGDVGQFTSLALDAEGKVYIAYYDVTNADLKFASNATGSWVSEIVDTTGDVGRYASLKVTSGGKAHVAYYDATSFNLKYANNKTGSWVKQVIDGDGSVGSFAALALGSGGGVHVSYYDGTNFDLKYATNTSGSWTTQTLDATGDVGRNSSIALDTTGHVMISYYDVTDDNLKRASNVTGSWEIEELDELGDVGSRSSLQIDEAGIAYVAYYNHSNKDLLYLQDGPSGFMVTPVVGNSTLTPAAPVMVAPWGNTAFTVATDGSPGYTLTVSGCGGTLNGDTFTTGVITEDCTVSALNQSYAPTDISLASVVIEENRPAGTLVGTLLATDNNFSADLYSYALVSGDGDTDNLLFAIDSAKLVTAETLDYESQSSYSVRIAVTDATENTFEKAFVITAVDKNEAPDVLSQTELQIVEDSGDNPVTLPETDVDGDTITYAVVGGGSVATVKAVVAANILTFTPAADYNTDGTPISFTISASDGLLTTYNTISVTVQSVNDPPVISGTPGTSVSQNAEYVYTFDATDVDGDDLSYTAVDLPSWLTLDSTTKTLSGTPDAGVGGAYTVTLQVSDGTEIVEQALTISVSDVTDPTLAVSTLADGSITGKDLLTVSGEVSDDYALATVTVNGAEATVVNGLFSTAVTLSEGPNTILVVATDEAGNSTTESRSITLDSTAPVVSIVGPEPGSSTSNLQVTLSGTATDASSSITNVTVNLNGGAAEVMSLTGDVFSYALTLVEGVNTIIVTAENALGTTVSDVSTVIVDQTAPTVSITSPSEDMVTGLASQQLLGTFSDDYSSAVSISATLDGVAVTPIVNGGTFSLDIFLTEAGTHEVVVTATDEVGNQSPSFRNFIYRPKLDLTGDDSVDIADALLVLQMAAGSRTANLDAADVAPLVNGVPQPDGKVSAIDALVYLRYVIGDLSW